MRKGRGEIVKLSTLFEKYAKTLKAPQATVLDCFCEVVEELIQYPISKNKVTYVVYSKTIKTNVPGPIKSEIQLRKKEILAHMKGRIGEQSAPNEIL